MSEKFKKLKRKYLLAAIMKSVVCGLALALLVVGGVLLAFKLSANTLDVVWYVVMGAGTLLVVGAIAFLFFRPTNKKVATRLDNEFGLEERVQTSLEYSECEGTIVQLQREDTEEKLQTLPRAKFKLAGIWRLGVVVIVALAIAVAGFVVPQRQRVGVGKPLEPDELPAVVTEYHITSVQGIITNVQGSRLDGEIRTKIGYELQDLLNTLNGVYNKEEEYLGFTQGQLDNTVYKAIDGVAAIVYDYANYASFASALKEMGETNFSAIIQAGGDSYKTYDLKEYGHVETFYSQREDATKTRIDSAISPLRDSMKVGLAEGLGEVVNGAATATLTVLSNPTELGVERTDAIYTAINSFATSLFRIVRNISTGNYEDVVENENGEQVTVYKDGSVQNDLDAQFEEVKNSIALQLTSQSYYGAMRRYISNKLRNIFGLGGIEEKEALEGSGNGGENGGGGDKEDPDHTGGEGGGDPRYAGEDKVYDPDKNMRVKYYELLTKYRAILKELYDKGAITKEQFDMGEAYFGFMFNDEATE